MNCTKGGFMNKFSYFIKKSFSLTNEKHKILEYELQNTQNSSSTKKNNKSTDKTYLSTNLQENKTLLETLYHTKKSTDIIIREFNILIHNIEYKSFLIFIDGMVDSNLINDFVLLPLMFRNPTNSFNGTQKEVVAEKFINNEKKKEFRDKPVDDINVKDYIFNNLIPQNSVQKADNFSKVFSAVNTGDCVLFIDTLDIAFDIDVKGFKQRSIDTPSNEIVVRGSQESFVENLRTNTSILRRLINNENLVLESIKVGKFTHTNIAIGYINGIVNKKLVEEVQYRINNLDIEYLTSSGQLEQLIQDDPNSIFPQILATERPDKTVNFLLDGRVCILVNGSPYALVLPGVFVDFLSSPEDLNLKYQFANLGKLIRLFSLDRKSVV